MSRPQRLIGILAALQSRRRTSAESLAAEFGVSVRTVLRDIRTLVDADLPIVTERGRYGGISLLPGGQVDLGKLTAGEADVLRAVGVDLDRAAQLGAAAAARGALGKLKPRRPPGSSRGGPPLALADVVTVDSRGWLVSEATSDVSGLAADLRQGVRLRIHYRRSGEADAALLDTDPYGLLLRADRWYLVADVAGTPRLFALSRLLSWQPLPEPRRLREGATLDAVARDLGHRLDQPGEVVITARLAADRLDLARRILGSRLRTTAPDAPGRVLITVAYEQLEGVRQLLQFADHLEVLAPPVARALVRDLAQAVARNHH
ncbi:helix-turn-helix transcriptional regulator [Symbioplanes lichenis]|uniref:helix-turn-helix transcriptional regulator n=1 Tax=Symbioplanes lichenis TaxID=1629072 RepID=UPI00273A187A|nr:WYL domain-containing protein [Actinoplanes lichenis]